MLFVRFFPIVIMLALAGSLAEYVDSGDVAGPIVNRLTNAVEQAQRHLDALKGRAKKDGGSPASR